MLPLCLSFRAAAGIIICAVDLSAVLEGKGGVRPGNCGLVLLWTGASSTGITSDGAAADLAASARSFSSPLIHCGASGARIDIRVPGRRRRRTAHDPQGLYWPRILKASVQFYFQAHDSAGIIRPFSCRCAPCGSKLCPDAPRIAAQPEMAARRWCIICTVIMHGLHKRSTVVWSSLSSFLTAELRTAL